MTALEAVSVYLPPTRIPIESVADSLGLTDMQVKLFRRFHGLSEVGRDPDLTPVDLLLKAASRARRARGQEQSRPVRPVRADDARGRSVSGQSAARGLPRARARPRARLHRHAPVLRQRPAGDRHRRPAARRGPVRRPAPAGTARPRARAARRRSPARPSCSPDTTIFGEGASACLVSASGARDRVLSYASNVRGEFDSATGENDARLQREYRPSLAEVMRRALDEAGLALDDIRVDPAAQRQPGDLAADVHAARSSRSTGWCWTTSQPAAMSSARTCSSTTRRRASAACCGRATTTSRPRSAPEAARRSRRWCSSTDWASRGGTA